MHRSEWWSSWLFLQNTRLVWMIKKHGRPEKGARGAFAPLDFAVFTNWSTVCTMQIDFVFKLVTFWKMCLKSWNKLAFPINVLAHHIAPLFKWNSLKLTSLEQFLSLWHNFFASFFIKPWNTLPYQNYMNATSTQSWLLAWCWRCKAGQNAPFLCLVCPVGLWGSYRVHSGMLLRLIFRFSEPPYTGSCCEYGS